MTKISTQGEASFKVEIRYYPEDEGTRIPYEFEGKSKQQPYSSLEELAKMVNKVLATTLRERIPAKMRINRINVSLDDLLFEGQITGNNNGTTTLYLFREYPRKKGSYDVCYYLTIRKPPGL